MSAHLWAIPRRRDRAHLDQDTGLPVWVIEVIDAEATVRSLEKTVAMLPKIQDDLKGARERLTDEEAKAKLLRTDLAKRLEDIAKAAKDYETLALANSGNLTISWRDRPTVLMVTLL